MAQWSKKWLDKISKFGPGGPANLECIRSKSEDSFKNSVKVKAFEFALNELNLVKETHSKMQNLFYTKL